MVLQHETQVPYHCLVAAEAASRSLETSPALEVFSTSLTAQFLVFTKPYIRVEKEAV